MSTGFFFGKRDMYIYELAAGLKLRRITKKI